MSGETGDSVTIEIIRLKLPYGTDLETIISIVRQNTVLQEHGLLKIEEKSDTEIIPEKALQKKQLPRNQLVQKQKDDAISYLKSKGLDPEVFQDLIYKATNNIRKLELNLDRYERLLDAREARSHELKMQSARMGINADPHITTEIEDLEELINDYNLRIEILNYWIEGLQSTNT